MKSLLKCILTNYKEQIVILRIIMLYEKYMTSALSRGKTIKLSLWYHESVCNSVIARVRNSGSHFQ